MQDNDIEVSWLGQLINTNIKTVEKNALEKRKINNNSSRIKCRLQFWDEIKRKYKEKTVIIWTIQ